MTRTERSWPWWTRAVPAMVIAAAAIAVLLQARGLGDSDWPRDLAQATCLLAFGTWIASPFGLTRSRVADERQHLLRLRAERSALMVGMVAILLAFAAFGLSPPDALWRPVERADWMVVFFALLTLIFSMQTLFVSMTTSPPPGD